MTVELNHTANTIEAVGSIGSLVNFGGITQGTDGNTYNIRAGNEGATAGSARGEYSVDLQTFRDNANDVATGANSVIVGGDSNQIDAGGSDSVIVGGQDNWTTQPWTFIGGGQENQTGATHAVVCGGYSNQVSNIYGSILGGYNGLVSGQYGSVIGGLDNQCQANYGVVIGGDDCWVHANAPYGVAHGLEAQAMRYTERCFANGQFFDRGDNQFGEMVLSRSVTHSSAAWFDLYLNGTDTTYLAVLDTAVNGNTIWTFEAMIVGATSGLGKTFSYKITGCVECDNGTMSILGQSTSVIHESDTNFNAQAAVDGTNRALLIQVSDSGAASDVVRWVCHLKTVQLRWNT